MWSSHWNAAAHQFAQRPYHDVGLDDILAEAELTKGAMYFHFRSKHALALAVIDEQLARAGAAVQSLVDRKLSGLETLIDVGYLMAVEDICRDTARAVLEARLGGYGVATWTDPEGGYFIDLSVEDGTATQIVEMAKAAGVALTPAGAAYPYGKDPNDRHIRLAPTMPPLDEVEKAIDVVGLCTLLCAVRKAQTA